MSHQDSDNVIDEVLLQADADDDDEVVETQQPAPAIAAAALAAAAEMATDRPSVSAAHEGASSGRKLDLGSQGGAVYDKRFESNLDQRPGPIGQWQRAPQTKLSKNMTFPEKVARIFSRDEYKSAIHWKPDGSFVVDKDRLEETGALQLYFPEHTINSFIRNLHHDCDAFRQHEEVAWFGGDGVLGQDLGHLITEPDVTVSANSSDGNNQPYYLAEPQPDLGCTELPQQQTAHESFAEKVARLIRDNILLPDSQGFDPTMRPTGKFRILQDHFVKNRILETHFSGQSFSSFLNQLGKECDAISSPLRGNGKQGSHNVRVRNDTTFRLYSFTFQTTSYVSFRCPGCRSANETTCDENDAITSFVCSKAQTKRCANGKLGKL
jgi:HSF-type DNA-binding